MPEFWHGGAPGPADRRIMTAVASANESLAALVVDQVTESRNYNQVVSIMERVSEIWQEAVERVEVWKEGNGGGREG